VIYSCCDENRREAVASHPTLNGIHTVEVIDKQAPPDSPRQRTLLIRFLKTAPPLAVDNFEITGGERIAEVGIEWVTHADAPSADVTAAEQALLSELKNPEQVLVVRTRSSGDHSNYNLHLVASSSSLVPPSGIDPLLARVSFSFKVECPSDFDCKPARECPPPLLESPPINYLAKDYRSFRRLMLDRMSQILPEWRERNATDLGITLVELLAYVADRLSYTQDAVVAEQSLHTARRRSSLRRLARLVDYHVHDGANARVWVQVEVEGPAVTLVRNSTKFLTRVPGAAVVISSPGVDAAFDRAMRSLPEVFEPLHDKTLHEAHNELQFYTWGDAECCLSKGATRATLVGDLGELEPGDVLIFEEILGPRTGKAADADPAHRHAVRLTQVESAAFDALTNPATAITEIRWSEDDALPFSLCLSSRVDEQHGGSVVSPVSRALGNVILADHGLTDNAVALGSVPAAHLFVAARGTNPCDSEPRRAVEPRFRPRLAEAAVTQAAAYAHPPRSALEAQNGRLESVRPQVTLTSHDAVGTEIWSARRDLLGSRGADSHFVVEVERAGDAFVRFGDGTHGRRPLPGAAFEATLRLGNGPSGNVGREALAHVVTDLGGVVNVRNPLAATGGLRGQSMGEIRTDAPQAFKVQERAVTADDYAAICLRHRDVQRAAATFRWNGHGHTVFVTIDRYGGRSITPAFQDELVAFLEPYRMAGYDVRVDAPRFVSLDVELMVCVSPSHFRSDVLSEVLDVLSRHRLKAGGLGLFHPDNYTFAQPVYASQMQAAAQAVPGVQSVSVTRFQRLGVADPGPLQNGVLPVGRLEIARLDNDPNFPEHGVLKVKTGGGK
jgi:hypothetical protein